MYGINDEETISEGILAHTTVLKSLSIIRIVFCWIVVSYVVLSLTRGDRKINTNLHFHTKTPCGHNRAASNGLERCGIYVMFIEVTYFQEDTRVGEISWNLFVQFQPNTIISLMVRMVVEKP